MPEGTAKKRSRLGTKDHSRGPGMEVILPATSANLGPAFDAAALALNLFLKIRAEKARQFSIRAIGRDADICGNVENNLILSTYSEILQAEKKTVKPLSLHIENQIPIGKGCGSSAAARLAGIALAVHFGNLQWDDNRIIGEASRREGHADNAAACWLGGLAIARVTDGEVQTSRIIPKGTWRLILAIPEKSLATEKARKVLPEQYSRADAVSNIQSSMLLLAAFSQGSSYLSPSAFEDKIHQPYRSALCPLFPALQRLSSSSGILGVTLSGAGPSVLVFSDPKAANVDKRIHQHLHGLGLNAEVVQVAITSRGGNFSLAKKRRTTS